LKGSDQDARHYGAQARARSTATVRRMSFSPHSLTNCAIPSLVLDIGMPHLNGYLTVQKMVGQPWAGQTFFIALTGWGQDADRQRALEAGFHLHLVKPVEPDALARLFDDRFPR
jgi:CheY-like chemotaxis protein